MGNQLNYCIAPHAVNKKRATQTTNEQMPPWMMSFANNSVNNVLNGKAARKGAQKGARNPLAPTDIEKTRWAF